MAGDLPKDILGFVSNTPTKSTLAAVSPSASAQSRSRKPKRVSDSKNYLSPPHVARHVTIRLGNIFTTSPPAYSATRPDRTASAHSAVAAESPSSPFVVAESPSVSL